MLTIDPPPLHDALGSFTTGVTIVTTRDPQARDVGLVADSFNSVSLDPPMVLWRLAKSSLSLAASQLLKQLLRPECLGTRLTIVRRCGAHERLPT